MKYIKIYEEYSCPTSVIKVAEIVYNRLIQIVENKSNLEETLTIEIGNIFPDFPIYAVNCYLNLKKGNSRLITGRYLRFVNPTEHASVKNIDGSITIGFELVVNLDAPLDEEDKKKIHSLIVHELLHCFQDYKMKNFSANEAQMRIVQLYMKIHTFCRTEFSEFLILAYACSSKIEMDAYLAQSNICKSWSRYLNKVNASVDDLVDLLISFDLLSKEEKEIAKFANEIYSGKIGDSFVDVVEFYRKMILSKKDYLFRKLAKIK